MVDKMTPVHHIPDKFRNLKRAFIDTSSIIYLNKIDQYSNLIDILKLVTIPDVVDECGFPVEHENLEIVVFNSRATDTTDERILGGASRLRLPVISDDKKLLLKSREAGLDCFNSAMMIHFLFFKDRLDSKSASRALNSLNSVARYQKDIWDYSEKVFKIISSLK